jgi:predicted O-methyltransferase YrrM
MANRTLNMNDSIHAYLLDTTVNEPPVLAELREETGALPTSMMQIGPEQGAFMAWMIKALGVRRAIEIGTYTGYSSLAMARALPPDGKLICCDVSEEFTSIARRYWEKAGLADRIELKIAPASQTIAALIADGHAGTFDFAFIDADKLGYDAYYEGCLTLLRAGGTIAIDNVLWSGKVAEPSASDENTVALRKLNAKIGRDPRVDACTIPVGDGITLARKRP